MINALQITNWETEFEQVPIVNKKAGPRIVAISYLDWCASVVAGCAARGIEAQIRWKELGGARCCAVWRDGRGCYRMAEDAE